MVILSGSTQLNRVSMFLAKEDPPEGCCLNNVNKRRLVTQLRASDFLVCCVDFLDANLSAHVESSLSLRVAACCSRGNLVFSFVLRVSSWLHRRSFSLLAQIIHSAGVDFLISLLALSSSDFPPL